MKLPHDSFSGTVAAGLVVTCLLIVVVRWLAAGA
jgi:hypothetical protein